MLIYNTTFQVDDDVHDNFMIWIKESYIPEVQKHGALKAPRICRILSHRNPYAKHDMSPLIAPINPVSSINSLNAEKSS